MGGIRELFIFLMLLASFAYAVTPAEAQAFVNETVSARCNTENVQAVYVCSGDVVRVISAVPGAGSTFYTPEGKVINCPVIAPTQMGAECMHMMTPNFCLIKAECGSSPTPQVFPGQNGSAEQTGNESYYVDESTAASANETTVSVAPAEPPKQAPKRVTAQPAPEADVPAPAPANFEFSIDNLVLVLFALGAVSVAVLFMLFRNSLTETE